MVNDLRGANSIDQSDPRWRAVVNRDRASDGSFVYAVVTTGVYCRPSCSSRRAKRANVRFFSSADEAETAGFRACRRCHPNGVAAGQAMAAVMAEACRQIERAEDMPRLEDLAASAGLSPFHFQRRFKAIVGVTPKAYGAGRRAKTLRAMLADGEASVTQAIYGAGFNSSGHFYAQSHCLLGMTPSASKRGGEKTDIRFAVGDCALGAILVASTDKGLCAVALGDDPEQLLRDLQDRFPRAGLIGGDAEFETLVARVVGLVETPEDGLDLPLDIRGTAFQQRVWRALQHIPVGRTASYAEIARRIGQPTAARAVAKACAANPVALVIPCHRVVRTDGALSGYRWGVARKSALLETEAKTSTRL